MVLDVVGLGVSCVDYTGVVENIPSLDETTLMLDFSKQMGGPVAVALVTFSYLGGTAGYIGKVAKDDEGKLIKKTLNKFKVDMKCLIEEEDAQTPLSFILVEKKSGKRTIIFNPGCSFSLRFSELNPGYISQAKFLHLDGGAPDAAAGAADWARKKGVKVVLDAGVNMPHMVDLVKRSDIVIASENFVLDFTQKSDIKEGIKEISKFGPAVVVATCGAEGTLFLSENGVFYQPVFKVNVVDTTGAGDVFHGAFLYGLVKGWNLQEIVKFSSATAAIKCTKLGGLRGIPGLEEVNSFLRRENS